mgnify:CR=1 FL=1
MCKFIAIKGAEGAKTGYFVPHLYQLVWSKTTLKYFGLRYVLARLKGWTISVSYTHLTLPTKA